MLSELRDQVDAWVAAATTGARGLDDAELALRSRAMGIDMQAGGTVTDAMRLAAGLSQAGDRIVVFGSFHTVGPALALLAARGLVDLGSSL